MADVERIAPCLPGARLEGREGDVHRGAMRVKVGPSVVDYAGTLIFEELDPKSRRAVLLARGEEPTGGGSAEARIVNSVEEDGDGSLIVVETDLQVRGKVAQFGSGPMEKIAKKMFAQFAKNLEAMMKGESSEEGQKPRDGAGARPTDGSSPAPAGETQAGAEPEPLNLVGLLADSAPPWVRTAAVPAAVALAIGYLLGRGRGR